MNAPAVLLTAEGTYPCHQGGVSVWCDHLIRGLPNVDFHLFSITNSPSQRPVFELPPNVKSAQILPLWGTEEPGQEDELFSRAYRRKIRTTAGPIREKFLGAFRTAVQCLVSAGSDPTHLASALTGLYEYFRQYDYAKTVSSPEAWDEFLSACADHFRDGSKLDLEEATNCMRWLQRYLAVLSVEYPRVDITHATMSGLAAIPGVIGKCLHGSRFLVSEHGIHLRELYLSLSRSSYSLRCKRFLLALHESVARMNYHYADAVTSLCDFNKRWQIRLGVQASKIRIVPNGADPEVFAPRYRTSPERPSVLTMSRIFPLKGTDVLLRAAARVRDRVPDVHFQIMGEVGEQEYFENCLRLIAEYKLGPTIEFGLAADSAAAYNSADIFCLSSISEAMPYSVLEAMLSGCPVVATEVGGVPELLGGTGLLVKPNDPQDLARGLLYLLEGGPLGAARRAALSSAALARARQHYTLRGLTERYHRLYRELDADDYDPEVPHSKSRRPSLVAAAGRS